MPAWLFGTSRLRLVVVVGAEDFGVAFADRLLTLGCGAKSHQTAMMAMYSSHFIAILM